MAPVEGSEGRQPKPLSGCDHRSVNSSQGQVSITPDQLCDTHPIRWFDMFAVERAAGKITQKAYLGLGLQTRADQIRDFSDDEQGNDERSRIGLEQLETGRVVPIVGVHVGVQRACIDEECYAPNSRVRIASICSDTS